MKTKLFSSKIIGIISVLCFFVGAGYFVRDLRLTAHTLNIPEVVIESLSLKKTVDGKEWDIQADKAEHKEGVISASSLVITVQEKVKGNIFYLTAQSGDYSSNDLKLYCVSGDISLPGRIIHWETQSAHYEGSSDRWELGPKLYVHDMYVEIRSNRGRITKSGDIYFYKGVQARWSE